MVVKTLSYSLVIGGFSLFILSCVDVPSSGDQPQDYHASARFIHVATDVGSGNVAVDGSQVGSLTFGQATEYLDFQAGGRDCGFSGTTQKVTFRPNSQNTVLIYSLTGSKRFLNL